MRAGKNVWYTRVLGCEGGGVCWPGRDRATRLQCLLCDTRHGTECVAAVQLELQGCEVFCLAYDRAESVLLRSSIMHMVTNLQLLTLSTESLFRALVFYI